MQNPNQTPPGGNTISEAAHSQSWGSMESAWKYNTNFCLYRYVEGDKEKNVNRRDTAQYL